MIKLSSEKAAAVLAQVSPALRALSQENQELREKVAHYEKRERVVKLASEMEEKRLDPETSFEEKVSKLMASQKLETIEEAVHLSAPQLKIASLSDGQVSGGDAVSTFESAILGE